MQCETSCVLIQITSSGRIWKQQTATYIIQQHWTTSADTYNHHSATVNSIQHQLALHCYFGHPSTTCNIPMQHETSCILIQQITSSGRISCHLAPTQCDCQQHTTTVSFKLQLWTSYYISWHLPPPQCNCQQHTTSVSITLLLWTSYYNL